MLCFDLVQELLKNNATVVILPGAAIPFTVTMYLLKN